MFNYNEAITLRVKSENVEIISLKIKMAITIVLTVINYLFYRWRHICSKVCTQNPVIILFMKLHEHHYECCNWSRIFFPTLSREISPGFVGVLLLNLFLFQLYRFVDWFLFVVFSCLLWRFQFVIDFWVWIFPLYQNCFFNAFIS